MEEGTLDDITETDVFFLAPVLGLKASLERLQLDYVDVVFANRPDPNTPMEGTVQWRLPYVGAPLPVSMATAAWRLKPCVTKRSIFKCCGSSWLLPPH